MARQPVRNSKPGSAKRGLVVVGETRAQRALGAVWLVGAGPGDPDLLTFRAFNALRAADVVVHDGLVSDEILDLAPTSARRIAEPTIHRL